MELDMIPLKDYTEAQELDRRLGEDVTLKNALVHYLSLLGGQDLNKVVKGILKELMTKDLAQQCNFKGHRGPKKAFSVLANILNVILKSVRLNPGFEKANTDAVNKVIANYLRYSFDLDGGAKQRKSKTAPVQELNVNNAPVASNEDDDSYQDEGE